MAAPPVVEIREPGQPVRRVTLDRAIEIGRECDGELVADPGVSRRHLKLVPSPTSLSVVDLGSANGTLKNGVTVTSRTTLEQGDIVRLGDTEIIVLARPVVAKPVAGSRGTVMMRTLGPTAAPKPPVPVPVEVPPTTARKLWGRILGTGADPDTPVFPNFMELPHHISRAVWQVIRWLSIATYLALVAGLFVRPTGASFAFFKVIVPILPLLFFVAPGLWRNICPLASANQTPRVLGFTRGLTVPVWWSKWAYTVAIVLFFGITSARLALFNTNAKATGILLGVTILTAFTMGFMFKGKSGWCSSICPLLPLQRVYGQTPFVTVANSHCNPCVACTKNCYDFNPKVAYQADMHDPDPGWSAPRKMFAAALPGFVLGFFLLIGNTDLSKVQVYERLALFFLGSIGSYFALDALLPLSTPMVTALYGAIAICLFYWYGSPIVQSSIHTITGAEIPWIRWPIRIVVFALALLWLARTRVVERKYEVETGIAVATPIKLSAKGAKALAGESDAPAADLVTVRFEPDAKDVGAEAGLSLLEVCEKNGQPIEAGCRMGVCGADPVAVLAGMDCLTAPEEEERNTLRRLGFAATTRMACCARLQSGLVSMALTPEPGDAGGDTPTEFDRSIASVVVIGNGIAGVTAADFIRRGHPDCEIHLVGGESHVLYNRMGISRLVFGRSAMQGLYLLSEQWYDEHDITAWLNTLATRIDLDTKRVFLGTGDTLSYDRLVLAMGSSSTVPPIPGFEKEGAFVMREAGDAMAIRAYTQQHEARDAVVAGGGLLGLEAAHSLLELGLNVTVLERGKRLMSKQIDERASEIVGDYFEAIGLHVAHGAETDFLEGDGAVNGVRLKDGRHLPCQVFLAAIGIKPNAELAKEAGIEVNRGVVVDDHMATSVPGVYAVGDLAEHNGIVLGLWPIAAKQGEVAAANALGGEESLVAEVPACILKGAGIELSSIGRFEPEPGDVLIVLDDPDNRSYRRMVISNGKVVGGVVIGHHPEDFSAMLAAVKVEIEIDAAMQAALRAGDWGVLKEARARPLANA